MFYLKNIWSNVFYRIMIYFMMVVLIIGFFVVITIFVSTANELEVYKYDLCFSNSCISYFVDSFSYLFIIIGYIGAFCIGVITIGTFSLAVNSYVLNKKATSINNHLMHLDIFKKYVESEVDKRDLLKLNSFDCLKWYNVIFDNSQQGVFSISEDYKRVVISLNKQIRHSNNLQQRLTPGGFRYVQHQNSMSDILKHIGINMTLLSRVDFLHVEEQVLDLISSVNQSYCMLDMDEFKPPVRLYE